MQKSVNRLRLMGDVILFLALLALVWANAAMADEKKKDMSGWEKGSVYDRYYNIKELEKFRATVVDIKKVVPMDGMAPGVALVVKESPEDEESIIVHICPIGYMGVTDIGLKPGDRLKIRGAWAEIKGQDVFMASKIKKGDLFELKLRLTKDGTPFWSMSEEERKNASD